MEKLGLNLDDGSSPADAKQANPQEAKEQSIQRCIQSLVHACQCRDANCRLTSCQRMKRVVQHTKICKRKTNPGCPICKQLIALCCHHAKHCQEGKCPVPFCSNIKYKMKQQQLQQWLQQAQLLRRQSPGGGGQGLIQPYTVPQMKPAAQGQVLGMGAVPGGLQGEQQAGVRPGAAPMGNQQAGPNPTKQVLQQLMHVLKFPHTAEQQQQILTILKANPQLMAAFIKQRQAQARRFPQLRSRWVAVQDG